MQLVTLTTDFGLSDHYVAVLKGTILSKKQDLQMIDVSHDIDTHDIVQAAFHVVNSYNTFPKGTIHVVAVYNFYQPDFEFVAFEREGHYFIGPNNGIFSLIFDDLIEAEIHKIDYDNDKDFKIQQIISHGVACIAHGLGMNEIGPIVDEFTRKIGIQPVVTKDQIRATIIHIDHFENVVVNLKKPLFEKMRAGRKFALYYQQNDPINKISKNYNEAPIGDVLCCFNAAGYMEIAINMGRAASLLGLKKNETVQINFY